MGAPLTEPTAIGEQFLIAGVKPISTRERLELLWQVPKLPA